MLDKIYIKYKFGLELSEEDKACLNENNLDINDVNFADKLLKKHNPLYFLGVNATADCVIIQNNQILFIQRSLNSAACPGMFAIPGGFINSDSVKGELFVPNEESIEAAKREFLEETGLDIDKNDCVDFCSFIGVFEGNNRDPRDNPYSWTQSHAWLFVLKDNVKLKVEQNFELDKNEVLQVKWFDLDNLPPLAFDHSSIVSKALSIISAHKKKPKI